MTLYSVSHTIQPWLLPPGINCFIILLGLLIISHWRTAGMLLIILGLMSLWLLSTPIVAYHFVNLLQNQYPILNDQELTHPKSRYAILVLGGGDAVEVEYGNKHTVSDYTLHRVKYAAFLHQKLKLPIIVSGGKAEGAMESDAALMSQQLQEAFQIKADFLENQSMTTADESKLIAPLLKEQHLDGVYLVTHAWHMPRSVYIFQCAGINVIPSPMGHYHYGRGFALLSYLPNIDALYASTLAMHEWIGLVWYHLYYGYYCKT